jgi:hypothetical protein
VEPGDPLAANLKRPLPTYHAAEHRFVPPPGSEIADPMVGFFRIGFANGAEAYFLPVPSPFDMEVRGTEGRAFAWDNGLDIRMQHWVRRGIQVEETIIRPEGESPTMCTIREIIRELETGERTLGNIDVTKQVVEAQFGVAYSHLQNGARVYLPVTDRSLYIPGG